MCLCSVLQNTIPHDTGGDQEVCGRVELLLTSVHDFLSKNQGLKPQLPFSLTKRASSTQSTAEKRIEKIFDYNPTTEYPTIDLLNRKAKKWNEQPLSFFARFEEPLDCDTNDPQQHLILCCLQLQESDAHSRILRRVYSLVLYRLRANRPRNDDVETIAQLIYDKLQKNGQEDLKALTKSIERMIQAGSRYENIVRSLGIGSLVVLGTTIPQTIWENWLPKRGAIFNKAMEHLVKQGIVQLGNVHKGLAEKVISSLESLLPKPPCNWVGGPKKRTHQGTSSKAKRPRFGANGNAGQGGTPGGKAALAQNQSAHIQSATGNAFEAGTGTEAQATGRNHYSMRILLTAAEQLAGQVPVPQYPSIGSSSIVDHGCPTPPEPRILFNESALCGARWNFPSHRDSPSNEVAHQSMMLGSDSETGDTSINSLHPCEADGDVHKSSAQSSTPLHMSQSRSSCEALPESQGGTWIGHSRLTELSQISRPPNEKQNAVTDAELFVPFDLETCFDAYGYGQLVDVVDGYDFFNPAFE